MTKMGPQTIGITFFLLYVRIYFVLSNPNVLNDEPNDDEGGQLSLQDFHNALNLSFLLPTTESEISFNNLTDTMLFEGDIELDETDDIGDNSESRSDIISNDKYKWTSKEGPFIKVPYTIPDGLLEQQKAQVARAIWEFRWKTCIKFVPRSNEANYIHIDKKRMGCNTKPGMRGGRQVIKAGDCKSMNLVHEMMHSLGFFHEHTRHDRSSFVEIDLAAIEKYETDNFWPSGYFSKNYRLCKGCRPHHPYDHSSIMHYGAILEGTGLTVIKSKTLCNNKPCEIGQRTQLSFVDKMDINSLYGCECNAGEFTCDTGRCIMESSVCDQVNDCGDNSDELNCPPVSNPVTTETDGQTLKREIGSLKKTILKQNQEINELKLQAMELREMKQQISEFNDRLKELAKMEGTKGMKGEPGIYGTPGFPGNNGHPGSPGPVGPIGPKGQRGLQGLRLTGQTVNKGQKGERGLQGTSGSTGRTGQKGQKGVQSNEVILANAFGCDTNKVALKSHHGKYVVAEPNGNANANRDNRGPWEIFTAEYLGSNRISLKSHHGKYLVAEGGSGHEVNANRNVRGPWEKFTVEKQAGGTIALKTAHGRYVVAESDGSLRGHHTADSTHVYRHFSPECIPMCSLECRCTNGNSNDGGVNVNKHGYCESYCHGYAENYYCGASQAYREGSFVDCRGCKTA